MASDILVNIGSGNADLLSIRHKWTYFYEISFEIRFFIQENPIKSAVCKMLVSLFNPECIKFIRIEIDNFESAFVSTIRETVL